MRRRFQEFESPEPVFLEFLSLAEFREPESLADLSPEPVFPVDLFLELP